ncbi:MAG: DUF58 domain-containing protein [Deltaproteobacteria bacterium]|nr:DUF58 domain-containing protein [Deltaproteobacteria bacterium]
MTLDAFSTHGLLDADTIAKISGFELKVKAVVDGTLSGIHKSPHRGQSVEFAEHKEYSPGDDVKTLDWKVFARSDRFFVKEFEAETNLRAYLLMDVSGSMGFGTGSMTKLEYSSLLAASLSYLLLKQGDAVMLATFSRGITSHTACRTGGAHLQSLLSAIASLKAGGGTSLPDAVAQVFELARRRSLVVMISDMLDSDETWLDGLAGLKAKGHNLAAIQVLDPAELDFPYNGPRMFEDPEGRTRVTADADAVREGYLEELDMYLARIGRRCSDLGAEHIVAVTNSPPAGVLLDLLSRAEAGRGRPGTSHRSVR